MRNAALILPIVFVPACGASDRRDATGWAGTIDTLTSGHIVVQNTNDPIWAESREWQVVEELRIGSAMGEGPDVFGQIISLEVDATGRIWILESQAQELRVFDQSGSHVQTIGRRGGGPGEFSDALHVELGPGGDMWVMDPGNNRLSVFDTGGFYLEGRDALGGFGIVPWPGRFDEHGSYYAPIPDSRSAERFSFAMVRHDKAFAPVDTLETPRDPVARELFEHDDGRLVAGVPFQGWLRWQISKEGTIWAIITDQYRLFELSPDGDTLRTITREFTPLPVTSGDREQARENLTWFTDQGGQVDWSKLPSTKPPVTGAFLLDDEGNLWVDRVPKESSYTGRLHDVFDAEGRYLGTVLLPFPLEQGSPRPIIRDGLLYGVTRDELDVPYVVRARIMKPE